MNRFLVTGGERLAGEIHIQGSKNSVLPILAATLTADEACRIEGCPDLSDTRVACEILEHLGCRVAREEGALTVEPE